MNCVGFTWHKGAQSRRWIEVNRAKIHPLPLCWSCSCLLGKMSEGRSFYFWHRYHVGKRWLSMSAVLIIILNKNVMPSFFSWSLGILNSAYLPHNHYQSVILTTLPPAGSQKWNKANIQEIIFKLHLASLILYTAY